MNLVDFDDFDSFSSLRMDSYSVSSNVSLAISDCVKFSYSEGLISREDMFYILCSLAKLLDTVSFPDVSLEDYFKYVLR